MQGIWAAGKAMLALLRHPERGAIQGASGDATSGTGRAACTVAPAAATTSGQRHPARCSQPGGYPAFVDTNSCSLAAPPSVRSARSAAPTARGCTGQRRPQRWLPLAGGPAWPRAVLPVRRRCERPLAGACNATAQHGTARAAMQQQWTLTRHLGAPPAVVGCRVDNVPAVHCHRLLAGTAWTAAGLRIKDG